MDTFHDIEGPLVVPAHPPGVRLVNPCVGAPGPYPPPHRPGSEEFAKELDVVRRVCEYREAGVWPDWFWEDLGILSTPAAPTLEILCESMDENGTSMIHAGGASVEMDRASEIYQRFADWLTEEGYIPRPLRPEWADSNNFIDREIGNPARYLCRLYRVMPVTFDAKSYYKAVRPTQHDPSIKALAPHPEHAEYGAGHSTTFATAAVSLVMDFMCRDGSPLPASLVLMLFMELLRWAHFRTVGGWHFPFSNETAFWITVRLLIDAEPERWENVDTSDLSEWHSNR